MTPGSVGDGATTTPARLIGFASAIAGNENVLIDATTMVDIGGHRFFTEVDGWSLDRLKPLRKGDEEYVHFLGGHLPSVPIGALISLAGSGFVAAVDALSLRAASGWIGWTSWQWGIRWRLQTRTEKHALLAAIRAEIEPWFTGPPRIPLGLAEHLRVLLRATRGDDLLDAFVREIVYLPPLRRHSDDDHARFAVSTRRAASRGEFLKALAACRTQARAEGAPQ